jgi:hypothetical protein
MLRGGPVDVGRDHANARGGESATVGFADAVSATGDDRYFAFESFDHVVFLVG